MTTLHHTADPEQELDESQYPFEEEYDSDPPTGSGPGWPMTIFLTLTAFCLGIAGGTLIDGTLESVETYKPRPSQSGDPPSAVLDFLPTDQEPESQEEWFPSNNAIDWSISIRPAVTTLPLEIQNESSDENRRILFHILSDTSAPRLAAILHIAAGKRAVIRLPESNYRLDVISTSTAMPWKIAQKQYAIPTFTIPLFEESGKIIVEQKLVVQSDGAIRFAKPAITRHLKESPPKGAQKAEESIDYGDLTAQAIADD